jgi:putative transposase
MRREKIIQGEYYHTFNRGNNKQPIFNNEKDQIRLLFLILYLQSPLTFYNISRQTNYFVKHRVFNTSTKKIVENRYIELVAFTLMPNHFHLILHELKEGGISQYMQRVLNAYTKYFNTKYNISGHLFQGPFQTIRIKDDDQLLYLSAYIHRNIREIKDWTDKEHLFPWSSYQDYIGINRWKELLKKDIISEQFPNSKKYKSFVEKSGAKESLLINKILFD